MDLLNLLIADDNKDLNISLVNSIQAYHVARIQGIALDGLQAYQMIKKLQPDIVLLDIQMSIMNGFEVINKLLEENYKLPKILLITSFPQLINEFTKINLISGILFKPFDFKELNKYLSTFDKELKNDTIYNQIIEILSTLDFNINSLGYTYLLDSIITCLNYPYFLKNLEKDLYPTIARKYDISNSSKIKWSIEKSINSMFRYTKAEILKEFFPNLQKPSPKIFIKHMLEIYRKKYNYPSV